MVLSPGTRLGPYEITAAIGAGGMGEVYRARDASLNRDVAIKVLPGAMSSEAERLARFKREAQVLASLNHPNIAHVYGFENATLQDAFSGMDRCDARRRRGWPRRHGSWPSERRDARGADLHPKDLRGPGHLQRALHAGWADHGHQFGARR